MTRLDEFIDDYDLILRDEQDFYQFLMDELETDDVENLTESKYESYFHEFLMFYGRLSEAEDMWDGERRGGTE